MTTARDWPDASLHVVSGKGGTGKTTIAAALALGVSSSVSAQQPAPPPLPQAPNMTFFVTGAGPGKGADLGGLAGADVGRRDHCCRRRPRLGIALRLRRPRLRFDGEARSLPGGETAIEDERPAVTLITLLEHCGVKS